MSDIAYQLMSAPNQCTFLNGRSTFLEFHPDPEHTFGFAVAQLINYSTEPLPAERGLPPMQRLNLAFSTADATITGWRLTHIADALRTSRGGAILTLPASTRYEKMETSAAAVASIVVAPIKNAG